jgi:hypothetical protein
LDFKQPVYQLVKVFHELLQWPVGRIIGDTQGRKLIKSEHFVEEGNPSLNVSSLRAKAFDV